MSPLRNKRDLISCYIDYPEKPQDIKISFEVDPEEGIILKKYKIPNVEEFSKLASPFLKHFVSIPDFFSRMKDIIETTVKLRLFAEYMQFNVQEQKQFIFQNVQQKIQKMPFRVVMPDAMNKKDRLRYKNLRLKSELKKNQLSNYSMGEMAVLFDFDTKARDFFAIIKNYPIALKASLNNDKKMKNALYKDSQLFSDLVHILFFIADYCDKNQDNFTQKNWNDFLFQAEYDYMLSYAQENVVNPSMMYLVDNVRRFLHEALIEEHGLKIAPTKAEASFMLKKDKTKIYKLAEKYGYIENVEAFLLSEKIRNKIAHPDEHIQDISRKALEISNLYTNFVFRFIDENFITDYYAKTPVSIPLEEVNAQYQAYQKLRHAEIISDELDLLLPEDIKHKNRQKKLSFLNKKGILNSRETAEIEELLLNRNAVAHGQRIVCQARGQSIPDFFAIRHALVHRQHS